MFPEVPARPGVQAAHTLPVLLSTANFSLDAGPHRLKPGVGLDLLFLAIPLLEAPEPFFSLSEAQLLILRLQVLPAVGHWLCVRCNASSKHCRVGMVGRW